MLCFRSNLPRFTGGLVKTIAGKRMLAPAEVSQRVLGDEEKEVMDNFKWTLHAKEEG